MKKTKNSKEVKKSMRDNQSDTDTAVLLLYLSEGGWFPVYPAMDIVLQSVGLYFFFITKKLKSPQQHLLDLVQVVGPPVI